MAIYRFRVRFRYGGLVVCRGDKGGLEAVTWVTVTLTLEYSLYTKYSEHLAETLPTYTGMFTLLQTYRLKLI